MTQSAQTTIPPNHHKILGLSYSKMKWWAIYIYLNSARNATVRLSHFWNLDSHGQETILAPSADKQYLVHNNKTCSRQKLLKKNLFSKNYTTQLRFQGRSCMTACSYHVTYAFQSESTLYNCLNVKELLARNRREIWSLKDCNRIRTHDHLVRFVNEHSTI